MKKNAWVVHLARANEVSGDERVEGMPSKDISTDEDADFIDWSPERKEALLATDEDLPTLCRRVCSKSSWARGIVV